MAAQMAPAMPYDLPPPPSIADEIDVVLNGSAYPAIRRLHWEFGDGVLQLDGVVPRYYLKQIVCSAISKVAGIRQIVDRVEVVDAAANRGDSAGR